MAPASTNGNANKTSVLQEDIDLLKSILAQDEQVPSTGNDAADLAQLLTRLDSANGVASGIETKLDGVLGNLDRLLESLEQDESVKKAMAAQNPSASGEKQD